MENKKFDKSKYDMEYIKTHKKKFSTDLNISEYEELNKILKEKNMTKAQFIRNYFEILKNDKN